MLFRAFFIVLVAVLINMAWSVPMADDSSNEEIPESRVTCDLLSFSIGSFKGGDAFCAANCIRQRYKGGYCNSKKVCVCRN